MKNINSKNVPPQFPNININYFYKTYTNENSILFTI